MCLEKVPFHEYEDNYRQNRPRALSKILTHVEHVEVREGQRGALRPRQPASGRALAAVRRPRAHRVRVVCALAVLLTSRAEIVVPQAPPHSHRRRPKRVFNRHASDG